ncbi:MAG: hypothetical protein MZV64_72410 [Ignavibacteriales bacterium]|nr:hypothetical protein [Ignavibacteriales bacterium]
MDNLNKMISAASGALEFIFNPNSEDKILILTDTYSALIAEAFKNRLRLKLVVLLKPMKLMVMIDH